VKAGEQWTRPDEFGVAAGSGLARHVQYNVNQPVNQSKGFSWQLLGYCISISEYRLPMYRPPHVMLGQAKISKCRKTANSHYA